MCMKETTNNKANVDTIKSDLGFYNPDDLYQCIARSDWDGALLAIEREPKQSRAWVSQPSDDNQINDTDLVRFLPLHSACARDPPLDVIIGLLSCYPQGAKVADDNGMLPLHYACANHASPAVIGLLLLHNSGGNNVRVDMSGSLPIHLAAQFGVSSPEVMDMLLAGNPSLACANDNDENTPLELAIHSEYYDGKDEVVDMLERAFEKEAYYDEDDSTISTHITSFCKERVKKGGSISLISMDPQEKRASLDTTIEFISTIDQMKKEIGELRADKALRQNVIQEQINREWGDVNNTLEAMKIKNQEKCISRNNARTHSKMPRSLAVTKRLLQSRTSDQITSTSMTRNKLSGYGLDSRTSNEIISKIDSSELVSLTLSQDKFETLDPYTPSNTKSASHEECKWDAVQDVSKNISFDGAHALVIHHDDLLKSNSNKKLKHMTTMIMAPLRQTIGLQSNKARGISWNGNNNYSNNEGEKLEYIINQENYLREKDRKLHSILEQNRYLEKELQQLKFKQKAYKMKVMAMEEVLEEFAATMNVISSFGQDTKKKLLRLENNVKATTKTRRDTAKNMLNEIAKAYQEMKRTKPQGIENCMKEQRAAIHIMDEMLMIIQKDV